MEKVIYNCLHPQKIFNPYTQESLVVSCGKCKACLLQKSAMSALKCKLESSCHQYCLFVTLTYSNEYVPILTPLIDEDCPDNNESYKQYHFADMKTGLCVTKIMSPVDVSALVKKCNVGGIPYLSKLDLQLFQKRLRKNLSKFTNEKIRIYAVGEYGPVHFRPHYHLLLWFSSSRTRDCIRQVLSKSWSFGRIDADYSRGKCASYVAGYLNSRCNLPSILQTDECKPFSLHSRYLGENIYIRPEEEIYKIDPRRFVHQCYPLDGINTEFNLWRSFTARYFPKCSGYASKSFDERYYAYTIYDVARKWTQKDSPYLQAKEIIKYIVNNGFTYDNLPFFSYEQQKINDLLLYFKVENKITDFIGLTPSVLESLERNIYMQLRTSKHFLSLCVRPHRSVSQAIRMIENFYSVLDYENLVQQYKDMQEFVDNGGELCDLDLYFSRTFTQEDYKNTLPYRRLSERTTNKYSLSFKHKKLNDLNNMFTKM